MCRLRHTAATRLVTNGVLRLLLRAEKIDPTAVDGYITRKALRLFEQARGFCKSMK